MFVCNFSHAFLLRLQKDSKLADPSFVAERRSSILGVGGRQRETKCACNNMAHLGATFIFHISLFFMGGTRREERPFVNKKEESCLFPGRAGGSRVFFGNCEERQQSLSLSLSLLFCCHHERSWAEAERRPQHSLFTPLHLSCARLWRATEFLPTISCSADLSSSVGFAHWITCSNFSC